MLSNFTLGKKVIVGFLLVAIITAFVGAVGYNGVSTVTGYMNEITGQRLPSVQNILTVEASLEEIQTSVNALLNPNLSDRARNRSIEQIRASRERYATALNNYTSLDLSAEETEVLNRFRNQMENWRNATNRFLDIVNRLVELGITNPVLLERDLQQFRGDHHNVEVSVLSLISLGEQFDGGDDHTACNFGVWLTSFETDSRMIQRLLDRMQDPHRVFHQSVARIRTMVAQDDTEGAMEYFQETMAPAVEQTFSLFDELIDLAGTATELYNEMNQIALVEVQNYSDNVEEILSELTAISLQLSETATIDAAAAETRASNALLMGIVIALLLAIAFGLYISKNISSIIDAFKSETSMLIDAATNGKLATRGRTEQVNFEFRPILVGVNEILDAVIGPLNVAAEYIDRISKGDIPQRITDDYKGDFNEIKNNLNQLIDAENLVADVAQKLSIGDVDQTVAPRSESDAILKNIKAMIENIQGDVANIQQIAEGNLQIDVNVTSDKNLMAKSCKRMVESLTDFLSKVKSSADEVNSGSAQISDASQSLSQGATESAASLEEISGSMTEIGSQTRSNAENASQASNLASQTKSSAETGNKKMTSMMDAMNQIQDSSSQIAKIIKVIDDIAFQTNLLALNAAVEAARAGRHGKGFAVAADEVRNLAGRSAKAAKETATMIETSIQKVETGTEIAAETEKSLQEIVSSSVKVADLVSEIAAASNEQAEGVTQIGQGLEQIDKVTQQNTANAEETAAAAEELSGQAKELTNLLLQFKIKNQGHSQQTYNTSRMNNSPKPQKQSKPKAKNPTQEIPFDDDEYGRF